ncbi:hypothetical protein [Nocardia arizonensis]|uniref:hypothetical protein n=1 Tax=Nocardia arizonensis TaxID=1141647 RepID=UPI0006D230B0|nr:hypothetical protein [Nocardia arizonensis]
MASREVTVTVTMSDEEWRLLQDAADCAGMTVQEYIGWNTRVLAQQSRPGPPTTIRHRQHPARPRRIPVVVDEPAEHAWAQSFTERLSLRADLYRDE